MTTSRGRMDARRPADIVVDHAEEEEEEEEAAHASRFDVDDDTADAHRQVLAMSSTVEILTRDFEHLQRELLDAYKKLQEYSDSDPRLHPNRLQSPSKAGVTIHGGIISNAMAKLRLGSYGSDECNCDHAQDIQELEQIITVKDTALTEALQERNEYKLRMERAENALREHQSARVAYSTRSSSGGLHIQTTTSRASSFTSSGVPYGMTSTSPVHYTPSGSASSHATSRVVPKHERFDQESSYQGREDNELFWRRQYRDAVRMRKHHGQSTPSMASGHTIGSTSHSDTAKPSLKIFSYPNANRQKGITDENVPFTRYIGISTRQNEIIKEQHRLLS